MFEELWEPIENVQDYLDRISCGPAEEIRHDKETLDRLVRNHQIFVPFENLDIYDLDKNVSLRMQDLYDKVVVKGRGGFCFELNALFHKLLEQLGFKVQASMARILRGKDYIPQPLHRVVLVELEDGWYFCDVGYGGPMPAGAVLLKDQNRQEVKGTVYHVEQKSEIEWQINCEKEGGMEGLMLFSMMEQFPMDFLAPSFYCCKHPNSNFRARRIVNRCLPDGHIGLQNQLLTIRKGEETQQIELDTPEAVQEALRKYFGIVFS